VIAGILRADAYAGFGELYDGKRKPGPITEAACWSHGRRRFFEQADLRKAPLAVEAVQRIEAIFAIERRINGQSAGDRLAVRQRETKPLVADLEKSMRAERARLSRHAATAQAIDYMLTRWPAFTRFLDDGRICLSNNAAVRALRGIALGRRAWLFAGSDRGGERAAAIYTLIATAKPTTSIRRPGSPTCCAALPIIRPRVSPNCFPGTGGPGLPHSRHEARPQFRRARGARGDRHRAHRTTRQRSGNLAPSRSTDRDHPQGIARHYPGRYGLARLPPVGAHDRPAPIRAADG
jgi:hypothetical protein